MRPYLQILFVALIASGTIWNACSDDPAAPPGREFTIVASEDYLSADIDLSGFPAGSSLSLRTNYWSTSELTADPEARVSNQSNNVYRLSFMNLNSGSFATEQARILLKVVDSTDELVGVVVLCDSTAPSFSTRSAREIVRRSVDSTDTAAQVGGRSTRVDPDGSLALATFWPAR